MKNNEPDKERSVPKIPPGQEITQKKITLRIYLLLAIAGGIFTLWGILKIPGDSKNNLIFGLSAERLTLCFMVLVITLAAIWGSIKSWFRPDWFGELSESISKKVDLPKNRGAILILSLAGIISGANFILFIPEISEPVTLAYYIRLQPIVLWVVILCSQNLLALPLLRYGFNLNQLKPKQRIFYTITLIFGIFLLLWAWIGQTGYGIKYIDVGIGWYFLGTTLLETQVFLAWGIAVSFLILWTWFEENPEKFRWGQLLNKDVGICILLWAAGFGLWMSQPLKPNWFAAQPRPPNYEFYPNSDTSVYDITAQNLLLGEGFKTRGSPYTLRPIYALFLALLHKIGGLSYEPIIWMQIAVLAFLPVLIYLLTKNLHSRISGVLAASLFILREMNAIHLADKISDTHAKLLMPFLPTALGILIFLWLIVTWLQNPQKRQTRTLISGGVIGIFMLIRPEVAILLPFVGIAALLQIIKTPKEWLKGMFLIACGMILMLAPWIWRNYQLTGTIFIDSPTYRLDLFARRYREDPIGFVLPTPAPAQVSSPEAEEIQVPALLPNPEESAQEQTGRLAEEVVEYAQEHPELITNFMLNHFSNNIVQTAMYFPSTFRTTNAAIEFLGYRSIEKFWQSCCSSDNYVSRLPFWYKWDGILPHQSIVPTFLTLLILSVGFAASWEKSKYAGMIPLMAVLGYYLINALVRNSGGRYIIPVDWVGIFYYSIGLGQLTLWGISFFHRIPSFSGEIRTGFQRGSESQGVLSYLGLAIGIFIFGCILPFVEKSIPSRYSAATLETKLQILFQSGHESLQPLDAFLTNQGSVFQGSALYPRFNQAHEMGSVWNFYQKRPYDHIDFYLSSPVDRGIILPTSEQPDYFPHASDALVFGCAEGEYIDALVVAIFSDDGEVENILLRSPIPENPTCPLTPQE